MTKITQLKRFTGSGALSALAVSAMLLLGSASGAHADYRGYAHTHGSGILPGVIIGGAIGGAVKGKKGIIPGAIIGGAVTGLATSAARSAPPPPPRTYYPQPAPVYNNGLVYNIQYSLTRLGYNPGPVDGVYGQRTAEAISAYEYHRQLPVTGQVSEGLSLRLQQEAGG